MSVNPHLQCPEAFARARPETYAQVQPETEPSAAAGSASAAHARSEIPATVEVDGRAWSVRRAWPAESGRIAIEVEGNGRIRAGHLRDGVPTILAEGADPRLPGLERTLSGAGAAGRLVSHRPGKRAVIRSADGNFVKCVRPGKAVGVVEGTRRAAAFASGFRMPEIVSVDDSTVVLSPLAGVELHDPSRFGPGVWDRAWDDVLGAWRLAGIPGSDLDAYPDPFQQLPVHSAESEVRVLTDWRDRAAPLLGPKVVEVNHRLARISAELLDSGMTPPNWGPIHRDLHDKQVMWDAEHGPGLLDVDTACAGERELDLGNLRAHARWRFHQGLWSRSDALTVTGAIDRLTPEAGLDPGRVAAYERSAQLRLVCVYAFRPRWRSRISALLDFGPG